MKKINPERMRYKNDTLSSGLVFMGIGFDIVYFVAIYSNSSIVPTILTGADVVINILFMLVAFWAGEMVKVYDKRWAYGLGVMAFIQYGRIFWLPATYKELGQLMGGAYTVVWVSLFLSGTVMLLGGLNSYKNSTILNNYLMGIRPGDKGAV